MEHELRSNLISAMSAFAAASGLKSTTVGVRVANDARFFERLSEGKAFQVNTYDRVIQWFSDNWPDNATWPDDLPRPAPAKLERAAS